MTLLSPCGSASSGNCDGLADRIVELVGFGDPAEEILVEAGHAMTYLANSADPTIGVTWTDPVFDDSTWTAGSYGVGYDRIDILALVEAGIAFCNNPEYGPEDVADTTMAMP